MNLLMIDDRSVVDSLMFQYLSRNYADSQEPEDPVLLEIYFFVVLSGQKEKLVKEFKPIH